MFLRVEKKLLNIKTTKKKKISQTLYLFYVKYIYGILNMYRVTHTEWNFRDDCTEFMWFVSLYLWFSATVNLFLSKPNKPLKKDQIQGRQFNSTLSCYMSFRSSLRSLRVGNPVAVLYLGTEMKGLEPSNHSPVLINPTLGVIWKSDNLGEKSKI